MEIQSIDQTCCAMGDAVSTTFSNAAADAETKIVKPPEAVSKPKHRHRLSVLIVTSGSLISLAWGAFLVWVTAHLFSP
jgi:hypothetical protein